MLPRFDEQKDLWASAPMRFFSGFLTYIIDSLFLIGRTKVAVSAVAIMLDNQIS